jgi:hypothetical protein
MNYDDPTDLSNVSIDGITERMVLSRAAETAQKRDARAVARPPPAAKAPAQPPPPPMPPKLSRAEVVAEKEAMEFEERQVMLDKIGKYRDRFPKLKKRNGTLTIKSGLIELYDELHFIEQQLGKDETAMGALKPANMCFVSSMYGIEMMTNHYNPLNLQLKGLGNTAQASIKSFEPLLDEFMIKHSMDMTASVEFRIVMMVVTTVATVHMANSGMRNPLDPAKAVGEEHADL